MMMTIFPPYFCSFWLSIECWMVSLFDLRGLDAEVEYILGPCLKAEGWELMFSFPVVHHVPHMKIKALLWRNLSNVFD
ncbi:hypothetical protein AAG906_021614 [Vitis piasezkii]